MKTHSIPLNHFGLAACLMLLSLARVSSAATPVYWDTNGITTGFGASTGTWDNATTANWTTSSVGNITTSVYNTADGGSPGDVIIGTPSGTAAAGVITISGPVSANSITMNSANTGATGVTTFGGSGTLTIGSGGFSYGNASSGGQTEFASTLSVILGASQTWTHAVAHSYNTASTITGIAGSATTWTLNTSLADGNNDNFTGVVADGASGGTVSVIFDETVGTSAARTFSNVANTYSGSTTVKQGSLSVAFLANAGTASGLGTGANGSIINLGMSGNLSSNTAALIYTGATASTNRQINLADTVSATTTISANGGGALTLSNATPFIFAGTVNQTLALSGTNTGNNTISGAIGDVSGSATTALTKSGTGTWVLNGVNTFSGGVSITGGTLSIGSGSNLGSNVSGNAISINGGNLLMSAATNVGSNQSITVTANGGGIGVSADPTTFPSVTDTAGGTLIYGINYTGTGGIGTIAGVNSLFTSTTTTFLGAFSAGSGAGTYTGSSLTVGSGSTYRLGGGGGTITIQNAILSGAGNNLLVGGTGGGSVILSAAGNTFAGTVTLQNGSLSIAAGSSLGAGTGAIVIGSGSNAVSLNYAGSGETISRALNFAGTTGAVTLTNSGTGAVVYSAAPTWTAGAKAFVLGTSNDTVGGTIGTVTSAPSAFVAANVASLTVNGKTGSTWVLTGGDTYTGTTTINGGVLSLPGEIPAGYINLSSNGLSNLAVLQTSGTISRTLSATVSASNLSWAQQSGFAAKGGTLTLNFNSGAALSWGASNFMGGSGGTLPMVFGSTTADNQVTLQNGFDFSTTTVGALSANFNRVIDVEGSAATIVGGISNNGISGNSALISGAITANLAGDTGNNGFLKTGSGTLVLTGTNTYSGNTVIGNGTLIAGASAALGTGGVFGDGHVTGAIAGTQLVTLGSNNVNGNDGTTATGASPTLLIGGAFTIAIPVNISTQTTTGTYTLGGSTNNASTFSGLITANQSFSVTQVATTGSNALNFTGGITGAGAGAKTVTFNNVGAVNVSTTAISDGAGTVGVRQLGAGTTTLSASSTYSGATTISGGILNVATLANINTASAIGKGSIAGSAADLVLDGGTLQYTGTAGASTTRAYTLTANGGTIDASGTVAGTMAINGNMTASGTSGAQTLNLTGTGTGATGGGTLGGSINNGTGSNVTSISKSGGGTWTLAGTSTFMGTTTITAGKLALVSTTSNNNIGSSSKIIVGDTSAHSSASLDVTGVTTSGGFKVQSGQTLAGHGTVVGNTTFLSGSILSPGNSAGTTTYNGNLVLNSGTSLVFDLASVGASDEVIVSGAGHLLTLNNQSITDFTFNLLSGYGTGTYTLIDASAGGITGALSTVPGSLTETLGGYTATLSLNASDVILTVAVVPEPNTWAMMIGGLALLVVIQRRKAS